MRFASSGGIGVVTWRQEVLQLARLEQSNGVNDCAVGRATAAAAMSQPEKACIEDESLEARQQAKLSKHNIRKSKVCMYDVRVVPSSNDFKVRYSGTVPY